MSNAPSNPASGLPSASGAPSSDAKPGKGWRDVWQVPALVGAGVLLVGGAGYAIATRPKADILVDFRKAQSQMEAKQYAEAVATLSERVLPILNKGQLTQEQRQGFHLMRARGLYLGQREAGVSRGDNHQNIVSEYERAEQAGATLEEQDQLYVTRTLLALGDLVRAAERTQRFSDAGEKLIIQRELIEQALAVAGSGGHTGHSAGGGDEHARAAHAGAAEQAGKPSAGEDGAAGAGAADGDAPESHAGGGHGGSDGHGSGAASAALDALGAQQVALTLLTEVAARTDLDAQTRLWVVSRQAQLSLAQGYPEDAATRLLRTLPRVMQEADPTLQGETLLLLARAYVAQHDLTGAQEQLTTALAVLPASSMLTADVLTLAGQIAQRLEQPEVAREHFARVIEEYELSPRRLEAMLGAAEVEFRLAQLESPTSVPELAMSQYQYVVDEYESMLHTARTRRVAGPKISREVLTQSIMARCTERAEVEDWPSALSLATLASSLYNVKSTSDGPGEQLPADVLLAKAQSQRRIAEDLLVDAKGGLRALAEADPATQREARELLLSAGMNFRAYGERIVKDDVGEYADALWSSADCYDAAGDMEEAIRAFLQFVSDFPSDARAMEGKFRLAEAYRARGDLKPAEAQYRDLLNSRDSAGRSGPYADASYVPLAQTLLSDESVDNDAEAEQLLLSALSGRVGGVGTRAYREALRELGDFFAKTSRHEAAIERYEEYLERVAAALREGDVDAARELQASPLVRYRLADAYRLSARAIDRTLEGAMPDSDKRALRKTRGERLDRAFDAYSQVAEELEGRERRGPLEDVALRNSFFFRGDCAFELGDFEEAIRQYDAAKERYPRDPASLVALTQLVSALIAKGDIAQARVANEKARKFYETLPESVWDDPALPMGKREWERWLSAQTKLMERPAAAADAGATGERNER